MSQQQQFQSAQRECGLQIITVQSHNNYKAQKRSPQKRNQKEIAWRFERIKRIVEHNASRKKSNLKNISFQSDDLEEISDDDESQFEDRRSGFSHFYNDSQQIYQKKKITGNKWLGNRQYFASIFIDPLTLGKMNSTIFKAPTQFVQTNSICFDSDFSSGNLFSAYKIREHEYDLLLQNDINTKGNTQWFYFRIRNVPKNTRIKINIVNMLKGDSLFNYGMKPSLHSEEAEKKTGQGWVRGGNNVKYFRNQMRVEGTKKFYFTLTFIISTPYHQDVLKVSQCYPYTLQNLNQFLCSAEKKVGKKKFFKRETIGQTLGKQPIQAIKIAEENPRKKHSRPTIIVTARQHPGQTPSSFVCEGLIDYLVSEQKEAAYLRKNYSIIIIPILNPDGVLYGNYRTNLTGFDLNRRWDGSKAKYTQQLQHVKKYIIENTRNKDAAFIIDLHGHSRKLFSFFYGNDGGEDPISVRLFPYICSKMSANLIRFEDCTFNEEDAKRKTARVQLKLKYKIPNIFTFQSSFFGFVGKNKQKVHFTQEKYKSLGSILAKSMFLYERFQSFPESSEASFVQKLLNDLKNKPQLISFGQKLCSGSETDPQKCEIDELDYQKFKLTSENSRKGSEAKKLKKSLKKEIAIKQISKPSRQLHVMDIARVNSNFPSDILALMPCKGQKKTKTYHNLICAMTQTNQVPFIKIYDACKVHEHGDQVTKARQKNNKEEKRSNLFQAVIRPKSSSNTSLEIPFNSSPHKKELRRRHDSGFDTKVKSSKKDAKKITAYIQTILTFPPTIQLQQVEKKEREIFNFPQKLSSSIINPQSLGFENSSNLNQFSTVDCDHYQSNKRSNQSFKVGLKALNVQTWRVKRKNNA